MNIKDIETAIELYTQRVEGKLKSHSRNWLIGAGIAVVLLIVLLFTVFKRNSENPTLTLLKQQQEQLDKLSREQKQIAEQDRLRDSMYYDTYLKNSARRESDLTTQKKKTNEIINRINQPDFNADSIKSWWANN